MKIASVVDETVNRIVDVYTSFRLPQFQIEANILKKITEEDQNLKHAKENGTLMSGNTIASLVNNSFDLQTDSGAWVLTLATMLSFSLEGIRLTSLYTKTGVEIKHSWLPCRARLIERFVDPGGQCQNSFTLTYNTSPLST